VPPPVHNPVIPVNNRVEKPVDNSPLINRGQGVAVGVWITNTIIKLILQSFPRLLIEKRYKLINFAPNWGNVDKPVNALRDKKKISKASADKLE
jgi:hypothetical protein